MKIIIGTANFLKNYGLNNYKVKKKELQNILNFCKKEKFIFFDCAEEYKNLTLLKKCLSKKNKIFYKIKTHTSEFKNIQIKNIYCLMIHNISKHSIKKIKEDYFNVKKLIENKPNIRVGISIYDIKDLNLIKKSKISFDYIQIPINIFNNTFNAKNTKSLRKMGTKFVARSIFLQGVLLQKKPNKNLPNNLRKKILKLNSFVSKQKISNIEFCLGFIKRQKWISKIIFGIDKHEQLKELVINFRSRKKTAYNYNFFTNEKKTYDPRYWN